MDLKQIIAAMTPEIRDNLSRAVEIGRWPDGSKLSDQQKASSMQAVIAFDTRYGEVTDEPFKVQKGGKFNQALKTSPAASDKKIIIRNITLNHEVKT